MISFLIPLLVFPLAIDELSSHISILYDSKDQRLITRCFLLNLFLYFFQGEVTIFFIRIICL